MPLVRAASLTNYSEVARAGGLDPSKMLRDAGLSPSVLREPDLLIPVERVGHLLQMSALASGNESFGLCMAESRLLSNLGAVGLLIRDQATLRDSLDVLMRYQTLLNGSLSLMIEESVGVVVIREDLSAGRAQQSTRQRIELALGVMLRLMREFLGEGWRPRRVCFAHPAPRDVGVHHRLFGPRVDFDGELNCIVCTKSDLDARNPSADPAMVRYAQQLLDASGSMATCGAPSCCCCPAAAAPSNRWPSIWAWCAARSSAVWRNRGTPSRGWSTRSGKNWRRGTSSRAIAH
jgi:hypothetical protein